MQPSHDQAQKGASTTDSRTEREKEGRPLMMTCPADVPSCQALPHFQQLMWGYKCPHLKISVTHRPKLSQQSKNYRCRNHKPQRWHVRCSRKQLPSNQPSPLQSFPFPLNCDGLLLLFSITPPSHLSFHRLKKNEERHRGCFSVLVPLRVSRCLLTASVALRQWAFPPLELQRGY